MSEMSFPAQVASPPPLDGRRAQQHAGLQYRFARAWHRQGKLDKAAEGYRQALALDPSLAMAYRRLSAILRDQGRVDEAISVLREGVERHPTMAELHKELVDALITQGGVVAAFAHYQLERQDTKSVEASADDVLCCAVVRNETSRLPYFLSYYRAQGVARFFIVDNDSTDGTLAYLRAQPDVYVWRSSRSFNRANFGAAWFELLLRQYGVGHWCLIVDADELLMYDGCERRTLPDLCQELDCGGKRVLGAILLDMYADRPIKDTHYVPGQPFLEVCPYFDRQFYHARYENWSPYRNQTCYFGGMRQRVFGAQGAYNIDKAPLIKYDLDCLLIGGQHWTNRPRAEIAAAMGCVLHFKYVSTFPRYVQQEVTRKEHYDGAMQYRQYAAALAYDESLTPYDAAHSIRYTGSAQLVRLGIIQPDVDAPSSARRPPVEFPLIAPHPPGRTRPFWSVMITAYTRTDSLARALRSVVEQAPGPEAMQIEVVNDAADLATAAALRAIVREVGGGRVAFYRHPEHLGHPHIFNLCIERARGHWVHILHDDDWVAQGFYAALSDGAARAPHAGAAFCRHVRMDEAGAQEWASWLEREAPGIVEDWLDRIAEMCRLQFVSIVVKRQAYEAVGGFSPQAASAFDWDMWKRIAVRFPVWYEPRPLAYFVQGAASETHRLLRTGEQIAHARRAIDLAASYLPPDRADELSARARQHYAGYALDVARRQLLQGDGQAAIANIREGLECCPSDALERTLVALLSRAEGGQA